MPRSGGWDVGVELIVGRLIHEAFSNPKKGSI